MKYKIDKVTKANGEELYKLYYKEETSSDSFYVEAGLGFVSLDSVKKAIDYNEANKEVKRETIEII
jgi:hypothetical protein